MVSKVCLVFFLAAACLAGSFARPTRDMELGDVVDIGDTDPTPAPTLPVATTIASLEEFADKIKEALAHADLPEPSNRPNTNSVTDENGNAVAEKPIDQQKFNDMLLNVVLEAVRKQVNNPDGSFDFMTILKQLFDVWAIRFDHNKDGEVSIAEFAQWLIEFVKTKIESF